MALESFPPLILVAVRFLLSGTLMLVVARMMDVHLPRGRELWLTALNGVIVLGVGNGCLVYAETWVNSGMAALFLTTSPFWMIGVEAAFPGGERLHLPTTMGMLIGSVGAALLVGPSALTQGAGSNLVKGFLLLQLGSVGWSLGSILQRRQPSKVHPVISGAVQQLAAGVAFLLPALIVSEPPIQWGTRGVLALLYLVAFGSIVGYSAYIYAMDKLPVAVVSIYTYINPVVAVILGWLFYRETFGKTEALAMLIIFVGVAIVKRFGHRGAEKR
jgi:drug/metabolite transporter (DMT)-like permease